MAFQYVLSNVSIGLADTLSYIMLVLVAILLLAGPAMVYYFWKQSKKVKSVAPTAPATSSA